MFTPAISQPDPNLMMINCDMSAAYISEDGGHNWRMIKNVVMLYGTVRSKDENGTFKGGIYRSSDRGSTWQSARGAGLNVETKEADQWAYDSIAQYRQLLTTDANPLTVYVTNTSTGSHPPHHETVYRSDDGGRSWRATFFIDPRFK
jgi:photosystem II stability/assembly factor-like uncharacterized protein